MKNGIIPVNKHGNVEVWDYNEALVPGGARYCGYNPRMTEHFPLKKSY